MTTHPAPIPPSGDADSRYPRRLRSDEQAESVPVGGSDSPEGANRRLRVVGLDLSLTSTGVAVVCTGMVEPAWTTRVQSRGRKGAPAEQTARRIHRLAMDICQHANASDLVVIEAPSFGSIHGAQHERGGLWWAVAMTLTLAGIPIATVTPQGRAKYATGRGNAGKDEVLAAVVKRYPLVDVTGNDVADAVVLAAMGCRWLGQPFDDMPQTHLTAMGGASWPV